MDLIGENLVYRSVRDAGRIESNEDELRAGERLGGGVGGS